MKITIGGQKYAVIWRDRLLFPREGQEENMGSMYQRAIKEIVDHMGRADIDPRHVEAFMRVEHGTLDALSREAFARDVLVGVGCIDEGGVETAESLAQSYGL